MKDIETIISNMTLEEKAKLCSGLDFERTKSIERLGLPSIDLNDGPHGLRKQIESTNHLGLSESLPATCFPSGAALASSWNRTLLEKVGEALGKECRASGVSVILGPAVNIKRSPLCGRNFEYFSEDPYLTSEMAAAHIKGVQSQGVGTSIKHFAANNQETGRMFVDVEVDERTLREIYLASFEKAVREEKPWTVMAAYNRVNGTFCCEHEFFLQQVLRDEWGFEGVVVSDWCGVNRRVDGLKAGLDLEMPSSSGVNDRKIIEAVRDGTLDEAILDSTVERLLRLISRAEESKTEKVVIDVKEHHRLARSVAGECAVLLKNEDGLLPFKQGERIAVIGAFAQKTRYQGGGSSHVHPSMLDEPVQELLSAGEGIIELSYSEGFSLENHSCNEDLLQEAVQNAAKADTAVIFAGLLEEDESETYDRTTMRIPGNQCDLIERIAAVQPNTIVALCNGSPIEMPWTDKVKGIIELYLGGQAMGGAVADILLGVVNPSGKLAETFPVILQDNPSYLNFPGERKKVEYREGIFVGYRYYEKKRLHTLFPFGHGLSYTTFAYTSINLDRKSMTDQETLSIKVTIKNTGNVFGKEIVQLYVRDIESTVIRPIKELKGFEKVALEPGEEKDIVFTLGKRAFAYFNTDIHDWYVEGGQFEILVGSSSADIRLKETVELSSTTDIKTFYTRNSTLAEIMKEVEGKEFGKGLIADLTNENGPMAFLRENPKQLDNILNTSPLRSLIYQSAGIYTEEFMNSILNTLNAKN